MKIGEFLVEKGALTPAARDQVLAHQKTVGLRFGDAALDLGLLKEQDLIRIFGKDFRIDFFYVSAEYFPQNTINALTLEDMLHFGVLPLGVKKTSRFFRSIKQLNLGLLEPGNTQTIQTLRKHVQGFDTLKPYLILADQMMSVLNQHYGLKDEDVFNYPNVHPLLQMV